VTGGKYSCWLEELRLMVVICSCMLGLIGGRFSSGSWSWNEADGVDLLLAFLA
jgi:hypothetical protein